MARLINTGKQDSSNLNLEVFEEKFRKTIEVVSVLQYKIVGLVEPLKLDIFWRQIYSENCELL